MDEIIASVPAQGLDDIDLAIIESLRKDGRSAFAQIAEQLGVSAGMIRLRYNRLVEQGYLRVVAITNPLRMGYKSMAMIGLRVDGSKLLEVAEKIRLRVMRTHILGKQTDGETPDAPPPEA